ncbi:MAG: helix-turn-helix domain-containing protein [Ruminococcaceae bacterium]|nr:helix-turn-helix domain-containing protein [Oscillospiraceae bacterium]
MNEHSCIEYVFCPSTTTVSGYHFYSTGNLPRKEFMHKHDYCELAFVRHGDFSVMSEDMHTFFHGPCLELFRKDSQHAQFDLSNTTYERFLLRLDRNIPSELESLVATINRCAVKTVTLIELPIYRMDWLYGIMHHLKHITEHENISFTDEQFLIPMRCLLEEIISICKNQMSVPLQFSELNILYVLTYIQEHLTEKISLESLAAYMHCGKTKLSEDFRKSTSMSVHQYILKERLALSLQYLESKYSISDIAVLCGFKDSSHYIHTFKKHYGMTPSQFKIEQADI